MKAMSRSIILTAVFTLLLSSCATQYHGGLKPVSPKPLGVGASPDLATVDSLQPTLSWKNEGASETKYDIIIYTGVGKSARSGPMGIPVGSEDYYVRGVQVYYREGIAGCSHHIEQPLEPKTVYVWAVRTRGGSNVGPWSTYDFQRGSKAIINIPGVEGVAGHNLWWSFRTPKR